jgi:hypothetical protein
MPYTPHLPPPVDDLEALSTPKDGSPIPEKVVTPVTAVTPELHGEVAWRVEAMRRQVPAKGSIPDLIARETPCRPGSCLSCGDPLTANQHYRCRLCAVAAAIAIWGVCPEVMATELARRESR